MQSYEPEIAAALVGALVGGVVAVVHVVSVLRRCRELERAGWRYVPGAWSFVLGPLMLPPANGGKGE